MKLVFISLSLELKAWEIPRGSGLQSTLEPEKLGSDISEGW